MPIPRLIAIGCGARWLERVVRRKQGWVTAHWTAARLIARGVRPTDYIPAEDAAARNLGFERRVEVTQSVPDEFVERVCSP